jgi:hypothetical protein
MLDMTASGRLPAAAALGAAFGGLTERAKADDADTVPKRPMNGALFQGAEACAGRPSFIRVTPPTVHRPSAASGPRWATATGHDDRLGRWEAFIRCAIDRVVERRAEVTREHGEVVAEGPEEPGPLQDDRHGDHAEEDHQPHDPRGAEADHDALQPLDEIHLLPWLPALGGWGRRARPFAAVSG